MRAQAWVLALALGLTLGCSQRTFVGFVVNQDAHKAGAKPGKSYACEPGILREEPRDHRFALLGGAQGGSLPGATGLVLEGKASQTLESLVGKTFPAERGSLVLEGRSLQLETISLTLQTLQSGIARGNFSARVKDQQPPWEVVGSFVAQWE